MVLLQMLGGMAQHGCRRRRMVPMLGLCAASCFLFLLYFCYSPQHHHPPPFSTHPARDLDNPRHNHNHHHHHLLHTDSPLPSAPPGHEKTTQTREGTGVSVGDSSSLSTASSNDTDRGNQYEDQYGGEESPSETDDEAPDAVLKDMGRKPVKPYFSETLLRTPFEKDKMDRLSLRGDDSDYLFPECPQKGGDGGGDGKTSTSFPMNDTFGFLGPFRYLANYKNPCWMEPPSEGEPSTVHCVPYFYLVGAPKAGSTDLYKRITMHPEVVKPASKETRWFDRKRYLDAPHFSFFLDNFRFASRVISRTLDVGTNYHSRIVGDGSPSYFFDNRNWPLMPGNEGCEEPRVTVGSHLHHLYPKARIIFLLRNPVDRLYSSYLYNHHKYESVSSRTFDLYVRESIKIYEDCFARHTLRSCANNGTVFQQAKVMLVVSLYSVFVQDWIKLFPRNQLHFVTTEQYNERMDLYLAKIYRFLGLRPLSQEKMRSITVLSPHNRGQHYKVAGPMMSSTRSLLEKFYRPYNEELARMLKDPAFLWEGSGEG
ncbi:carbohydrate sulfotransferase 15-like [Babylonia areolata]|uniref:carbohydrate sulfotransferase 15-like n=1 Tax=Babylonia areolata TaxID=304850 RepID=UPI003FCF52A9